MPDAGDVIVANIAGATGPKRRPGVVISSKAYHASRPDVIIGIITSNTAAATAPTDCAIVDWQAAALVQPSAFRAYIVTISSRDCRVIGKLSANDWKAVQSCVRTALEASKL